MFHPELAAPPSSDRHMIRKTFGHSAAARGQRRTVALTALTALMWVLAWLAGVLTTGSALAQGTPLDGAHLLQALNTLRARGCEGRPGNAAALRADPRLSAAAARFAGQKPLGEALRAAGYRAPRSSVVTLRGYAGAAAVAQGAMTHSCALLLDAAHQEFGFYSRGTEAWLVLAAPFTPPTPSQTPAIEAQLLQLVNAARSTPRRCGTKWLVAAPPVRLDERLRAAAANHADDMARHSYFSHTGRDGAQVSQRAQRVGYAWRAIGENLAAGQLKAEAAVDGWLKSPPHCANLMLPDYTDMGVAFAVNPASESGIYWAQVFGRPQ